MFNITWTDDPSVFQLFDYEADENVSFPSIDELREWLDRNESRHANHMQRNLTPMASADGWWLLKEHEFVVDMTHDGSTWIASVRKLPVTAAFASSLKQAVSNAREAITDAFQAPRELAAEIRVSARLGQAAVAAL